MPPHANLSRVTTRGESVPLRTALQAFAQGIHEWMPWLALAGVCCLRLWVELFSEPQGSPKAQSEYLATVLTNMILGGVFWLLSKLEWLRSPIRIAAVLLAAKEFYLVTPLWKDILSPAESLFFLAGAALIAKCLHSLSETVRRIARPVGAFITACVILSATWIDLTSPGLTVSALPERTQSKGVQDAPKRIVWISFDGLDPQSAFSPKRPLELRLPALDKFRDHVEYRADLLPGNTHLNLLLRDLDAKGLRTAAVGWIPSLCQASIAAECASWREARQANSYDDQPVANRFRSFFETEGFSPFGYPLAVKHHVEQMEEIERAAATAAARRDLAFVYLRLPHARPPYVWDPRTGEPNTELPPWDQRGHLRNLRWADIAFAKIRANMESSGVWDRSVVLVTSTFERGGSSPFLLKSPVWVDLDPAEPLDPARTASILKGLLLR